VRAAVTDVTPDAVRVLFWAMNVGLAGFTLGLILEAVILKRIFTPVLGVGILHGVALFTVALRKKGRSPAQTEATTPA
jgi:predicted membrane protein